MRATRAPQTIIQRNCFDLIRDRVKLHAENTVLQCRSIDRRPGAFYSFYKHIVVIVIVDTDSDGTMLSVCAHRRLLNPMQ